MHEWESCLTVTESYTETMSMILVTSVFKDRTIKSTVFRINGSVPAGNFIQIPKSSSQSLGLTGRFMYLLFKPTPSKYFVVHVDVATSDGLVIRISFSNIFKEFKGTSTWLQFPFICQAEKGSVADRTAANSKGCRVSFICTSAVTISIFACRDVMLVFNFRLHRPRTSQHTMDGVVSWFDRNTHTILKQELLVLEEHSFVCQHVRQEHIHERHGVRAKYVPHTSPFPVQQTWQLKFWFVPPQAFRSKRRGNLEAWPMASRRCLVILPFPSQSSRIGTTVTN